MCPALFTMPRQVELACVEESRAASRAAKNATADLATTATAAAAAAAASTAHDGDEEPPHAPEANADLQQGQEEGPPIVKQKARHPLNASALAEKCAQLAGIDPADPRGVCSRSSSRTSFRAAMVAHELLSSPAVPNCDSVVATLKNAADGAIGPGWADVAFLSIVTDISGGGPSADARRKRPKEMVVQARLDCRAVCARVCVCVCVCTRVVVFLCCCDIALSKYTRCPTNNRAALYVWRNGLPLINNTEQHNARA